VTVGSGLQAGCAKVLHHSSANEARSDARWLLPLSLERILISGDDEVTVVPRAKETRQVSSVSLTPASPAGRSGTGSGIISISSR